MKRNLSLSLLLIATIIILLNSCAVNEQFTRNFQESTEAYYAPDKLDGNTNNTGLLLIDALTKKSLNTMPLSGVSIANVLEPEKEILVGSFKTGGDFSHKSGVVVISNLKPGKYKIIKIKTQNINLWETLYMPENKEFEVEIIPGVPVYFGQIYVYHPIGTTDRVISINHEKEREIESWKMVTKKFSGSAWIEIVSKHILRLES